MSKHKEEKTNVMRTLEQKKIAYTAHEYPADGPVDGVSVADGINWELEEIRKTLPELKPRIDLTPVQNTLVEIQKSLTEMNRLLERVGNLSERYSSKWIDWLPDFSLLVALKWIMLVLILGTAVLAGWYGAAAIRSLFL